MSSNKELVIVAAICQFMKDEDGLAAAEYAFMLSFVAAALVMALVAFRQSLEGVFTRTSGTLNGEIPTGS